MTRWSDFASTYLKAADLRGATVQVRIQLVKPEEIGQGQDKETRPVLYFEGKNRGLVLNKTNGNTIADSWGDELERWVGGVIELHTERVNFAGNMVDAIRVRCIQAPAGLAQPYQPPQPVQHPIQENPPQQPQQPAPPLPQGVDPGWNTAPNAPPTGTQPAHPPSGERRDVGAMPDDEVPF